MAGSIEAVVKYLLTLADEDEMACEVFDKALAELGEDNDLTFKSFFGIPPKKSNQVLTRVGPELAGAPAMKLSITLRHLVNQTPHKTLADMWTVPVESIPTIVDQVCDAIVEEYILPLSADGRPKIVGVCVENWVLQLNNGIAFHPCGNAPFY